jgi:hypothetical protein
MRACPPRDSGPEIGSSAAQRLSKVRHVMLLFAAPREGETLLALCPLTPADGTTENRCFPPLLRILSCSFVPC